MPNWLLKAIQLLIAFAVMCAATYGEWTDNNTLIAVWGISAAFAATYALAYVNDWFIEMKKQKRPLREDDERWP